MLLATGGFEWNEEMNKRFIYSPPLHAYTCPTNEGDGHIMGMEVGAAVALMDHSIFQPGLGSPPTSWGTTSTCYRPFIYGYPGMIMVNRDGKRCCDECFYPDMGRAFLEYDRQKGGFKNWPIFSVCDQAFRDMFPFAGLKRGAHRCQRLGEEGRYSQGLWPKPLAYPVTTWWRPSSGSTALPRRARTPISDVVKARTICAGPRPSSRTVARRLCWVRWRSRHSTLCNWR